ncbi:MAG: hypothetical protein NXH88_18660 [Hyphomonas sp.]|nr:hypothetical protein [Hyphomonas sp.]
MRSVSHFTNGNGVCAEDNEAGLGAGALGVAFAFESLSVLDLKVQCIGAVDARNDCLACGTESADGSFVVTSEIKADTSKGALRWVLGDLLKRHGKGVGQGSDFFLHAGGEIVISHKPAMDLMPWVEK